MLRFIGEFVSVLFFFLVVRSAVSSAWRLFRPEGPGAASARNQPSAAEIRTSGELHKDPVCGTFVATTTPYTRPVEGALEYFCSKECRDLYKSGRDNRKRWDKRTAVRS